ncbi:hypothetical protein HPP92_024090 [Vanilla planifolia]|uniref:Legumain prodomain domain-containing protein n=1 Tax=Vanilla planifolia TaxID=51239 RepID=A0A835PRJ7_VANPL|nr:hypothetical protein HPP92_024090 [Vanilla planifolia]
MEHHCLFSLLSLLLLLLVVDARFNPLLRLPTDGENQSVGTNWAILIAGSKGYGNYRHQADVCHAYQVLKSGGLKDENIIVFMYDDIAYNPLNPRQGVIVNHPQGNNVYDGIPKDYVGDDVNVYNFIGVVLGDNSWLRGGSGKVVSSGPEDHIFIFYSDHGGPGVLSMPQTPHLYADQFIKVLKLKHKLHSYKSMVIYIEACESGSIFEGLLPENINIYATTAANSMESSWSTYCPGFSPSVPLEYRTCLGDLYSVSWLEDSETHDLTLETLNEQYERVRIRTSYYGTYQYGSHVMQFGDLGLGEEKASLYIGSIQSNKNSTFIEGNLLSSTPGIVNQRDAELIYYWNKFQGSPDGSSEKLIAEEELHEFMSHRMHVDKSINHIGKLLIGSENDAKVLNEVRPKGMPLVDDWMCLKSMVRTFETYCGSLSTYGLKHMRFFANICNVGTKVETMAKVSAEACNQFPSNIWSSLQGGFSA